MAPCLRCPLVVAAEKMGISSEVLAAEPVLAVLCVEHFRGFSVDRANARLRAEREVNRLFCACGKEIYFRGVDGTRSSCSGCEMGPRTTVAVTAGPSLSIKPDPDWYRKGSCEVSGCDTSPFRLPDGRTVCEAHGAPSKAEKTQDLAGRS